MAGSTVLAMCCDCDRTWRTATTRAASNGATHARWSGHRVRVYGTYKAEYTGVAGDQRTTQPTDPTEEIP